MRLRIRLFATLALVAFSVVGCALRGNARHVTVVGNVALGESLFAIQAAADALRETNQITVEQRRAIGVKLLPALETGGAIAKLTATWPKDEPAPAELIALVPQLRALVDEVVALFPDTPAKASLMSKIAIAQTGALALLVAFAE